MAKTSRFKKRDSDRDGFTYLERQTVKDKGSTVGLDEYDMPPPSSKNLGGEGESSMGDARADYTSYEQPVSSQKKTQYITASGGISYEELFLKDNVPQNKGWMLIAGSNQAVIISKNPQISAGIAGSFCTVQCVGSSVTLSNNSGLVLKKGFLMDSGAILNLYFYGTGWYETSRSHQLRSLGEF